MRRATDFGVGLALGSGDQFLPHDLTAFGDGVTGTKQGEKGFVPLFKHLPGSFVVCPLWIGGRSRYKPRKNASANAVLGGGEGCVVRSYFMEGQAIGATRFDDFLSGTTD